MNPSEFLLIATDEAGYGPKLGPLVIGCSAWQVDPMDTVESAFDALAAGFEVEGLGKVEINDSKQLFAPGRPGGLAALEMAMVAAALMTFETQPKNLGQWLDAIAEGASASLGNVPWLEKTDLPFPIDLHAEPDWQACRESASAFLRSDTVALESISAAIIPAGTFNDMCDQVGNKATLLSEQTVHLAIQQIEASDVQSVEVYSDKHGGRAFYAGLLQHFFPDAVVQIEVEGRQTSRYRIECEGRLIRWRFTAKGDAFLPVALASMVAKYTRERLMGVFNEYWQSKVPGLKPTAGYPSDANRFLNDIAHAIQSGKIGSRSLIRSR